jgi:hypothetical protein
VDLQAGIADAQRAAVFELPLLARVLAQERSVSRLTVEEVDEAAVHVESQMPTGHEARESQLRTTSRRAKSSQLGNAGGAARLGRAVRAARLLTPRL